MKKTLIKSTSFVIALILALTGLFETWTKPSFINENGELVTYIVNDSVTYGLIGLGLILVLIVLKQSYWKIVFALLAFISFTPLVQFYSTTVSIQIGPLDIDLISLGLLIFHFIVNPELVPRTNLKLEPGQKTLEKREALLAEQTESEIKGFEKRFASKSISELQQILDEKQLVPTALEASKRLLNKKQEA